MNVQDECIKIHSKFGMSEMANYKIQLLFDSEIEKVKKEYEEKLRWIPVEEKLPEKQGHYLVKAPKSFPKNCIVVVAEFYEDNNTFYSESSDCPIEDATHWRSFL